ncbi:cell division protein FtsN [Paucibacter oligotrophus]|uniref:Cell division protein FtsN n=1 Tax=Roseateles oligotrophus TaxID=1769250 RepID=A0A840L2T0_9BURK|nr:SPOR domain-containing protein [Roseateles oligotrophus]MBB4842774.1 cell division protein FtsN [Roseateles oligotrophus]
MSTGAGNQKGGFVLGLIVGLLVGLAVALGVALYVTKVPVPFINKVPQRTAEQDAEEAARNKNWDPNAPLAGKAGAKAASGVVSTPTAPAPAPGLPDAPVALPTPPAAAASHATAPVAAKPADKPVDKIAEKIAEKTAEKAAADKAADKKAEAKTASTAAAADTNVYFVQAGAFTKAEDAEQQRAKLAILGFSAKVMEREQSGRTVFRVRLGPFDARDEAQSLQGKLEAAGVENNLVPVKR